MKAFLPCAISALCLFATGTLSASAATRGPVGLLSPEAAGKIQLVTTGRGQTIGHVADLKIKNLTGHSLQVRIPGLLLESSSRKYQHYACPFGQTVSVGAGASVSVRLEGVCLVRNRPPVSNGMAGELIPSDGNPGSVHCEGSHIPAKSAGKLIRVAKSYCVAAIELEKSGAFKNMPYHNSKEREKIAAQWGVWSDPTVARLGGGKRATQKEMEKTFVRQAEKEKPLTREDKAQIAQGVAQIFQDVQLTSEKAKSLEEPDPFAKVELTGEKAKTNG